MEEWFVSDFKDRQGVFPSNCLAYLVGEKIDKALLDRSALEVGRNIHFGPWFTDEAYGPVRIGFSGKSQTTEPGNVLHYINHLFLFLIVVI